MAKSDDRQNCINKIETFQYEDASQCKTMLDVVLVRLSFSEYITEKVCKFVMSEFAVQVWEHLEVGQEKLRRCWNIGQ